METSIATWRSLRVVCLIRSIPSLIVCQRKRKSKQIVRSIYDFKIDTMLTLLAVR